MPRFRHGSVNARASGTDHRGGCSEPREALRSFGERLRDLTNENPHASEANLREAIKGAVQAMIAKSRGQRRRAETQRVAAESDTPRDVTCLPETRRTTRQDIPGPLSGRMLRGAESEAEQMHNYISGIGCNLHEAIQNRDADLIRSYRRALHSNREADTRGWDPAAVDGMLQEVEESTATLLPAAEQVSAPGTRPTRGWSTRTPPLWRGGLPCR
jgi:hypothetical protein